MIRFRQFSLLILLCLLIASSAAPVSARPGTHLVPIGGGYSDIYAGYMQAVIPHAANGRVMILVLPTAYASNPESITDAERAVNLRDAEERRFQIEEACKRAAGSQITCTAVLLPVFTRADAEQADNLALVTDEVTAVFILGGDQTVAMRALLGTRLEDALNAAYDRGAVIGGTSAGCGLLAYQMLAGYQPNFAAETSLNFGSIDLWNSPDRRGFSFGLPTAVLDQHFYQRSRPGRLIAAILRPDAPKIGIGVDAYTGVNILDERMVQDVFGLYTVTILDAETYHADRLVRYSGPQNTISTRNLLVHLLSPGKFAYDLETRSHSLGQPAPRIERNFDFLRLPSGAGTLLLGGDLRAALPDSEAITRFQQILNQRAGTLVVLAAGYPSERSAQTAVNQYLKALGVPAEVIIIPAENPGPLTLPEDPSAILVLSRDQSRLDPAVFAPVKTAWLSGVPLFLEDAAASLAGSYFAAHPPTPGDAEEAEKATQGSFRAGTTEIRAGLDLISAGFEPQLINDNRWGRFFSLAFQHPDLVIFGITAKTALEIGPEGARVLGESVVISLDLRTARLALGENQGFVIANGLMDIFAAGETLVPVNADQAYQAEAAPTPQPAAVSPTQAAPSAAVETPPSLSPAQSATPAASRTVQIEPAQYLWLAGAVLAVLTVYALVRWRRK